MAVALPLVVFLCVCSVTLQGSSAEPSVCPRLDLAFVNEQCPLGIERFSAEEVSGDILDRELGDVRGGTYYSVLFHASWCPFSHNIRPVFDALSSMFPQIRHLAVEESSAMPSVFSRYGVHGVPSILIADRKTRVHYRGSKDLSSLVGFYKEATGLDPVAYFAINQNSSFRKTSPLWPWDGSLKEFLTKEPYLALGLLFLCVKAMVCLFPKIFSHLKSFWISCVWNPYLGIFGESSHLLEQMMHVTDVKKLWNKLRLSNKTRNFQKGAKNARVWASSLASVSLGEASSSRPAASD